MSGLAPSDENKHQPVLVLGLLFSFVVITLLVLSVAGLPAQAPEQEHGLPVTSESRQPTVGMTCTPTDTPSASARQEPTITATYRPPTETAMPSLTCTPTQRPSPQPSETPTQSSTPASDMTPTLYLQRPTRVRRTTPQS